MYQGIEAKVSYSNSTGSGLFYPVAFIKDYRYSNVSLILFNCRNRLSAFGFNDFG